MSNVSVFSAANLPSVTDIAKAIQETPMAAANSMMFIKIDKNSGKWVLGSEEDEISSDSLWAINPYSMIHGYICWSVTKLKVAEIMVPMWEKLPDPGAIPVGADPTGWQLQVGWTMKCISGKEAGLEAIFMRTSFGSRKLFDHLRLQFVNQVNNGDKTKVVPIGTLGVSWYNNAYGSKTANPLFNIVRWESMDAGATTLPKEDNIEDDEVPETEVAEVTAGRRRRPS